MRSFLHPILLLLLSTPGAQSLCVERKDSATVIAHIFCLILLFIVLSVADMMRHTRPLIDLAVFIIAVALLVTSAACGAVSNGIMDELSWLMVGTVAVVLLAQMFTAGWWSMHHTHYLVLTLQSFSVPRLNLVIVFGFIYYQMTILSTPSLYYICVLYLAITLIVLGQPAKLSKYNNQRAYNARSAELTGMGPGVLIEKVFGRPDQEKPVVRSPTALDYPHDVENYSGPTIPDLPSGSFMDMPLHLAVANQGAERGTVSRAEVNLDTSGEHDDIEEVSCSGTMRPLNRSTDPITVPDSSIPQELIAESPTAATARRVRHSGRWVAILRLACALTAVALFITLCVLWATDPLLNCVDSNMNNWEFDTTEGSNARAWSRDPLFFVEKPFMAPGRMGILYSLDTLAPYHLDYGFDCDRTADFKQPIDLSAEVGNNTVRGYLKFTVCWAYIGQIFLNARFELDIPARYYTRVMVTQHHGALAWYGTDIWNPYAGFVMGLVVELYGQSYRVSWRVFAEPRVEFQRAVPPKSQ